LKRPLRRLYPLPTVFLWQIGADRVRRNEQERAYALATELILYALIAAGLVFWLRSILGTRHGEERERPNPFTQSPDKPYPIVRVKKGNPLDDLDNEDENDGLSLPEDKESLPRNASITSVAAERGIEQMKTLDPAFSINAFLNGAQEAFIMIVEAYAAGDRETLKGLLSDRVYAAFSHEMDRRDKAGEKAQTEIHAVRKMDVIEAKLEGKDAHIMVRFIADETFVMRDADGALIAGDPDRITEMNDIWVFSRTLKTRDPRWMVIETRTGDVIEDGKPPMPESR
jgi:predicted lipid-binding transport protein (Tim44 family)